MVKVVHTESARSRRFWSRILAFRAHEPFQTPVWVENLGHFVHLYTLASDPPAMPSPRAPISWNHAREDDRVFCPTGVVSRVHLCPKCVLG